MIPENLQLISVQPHDFYFLWQVEVQIVNFRKFGLSDKMHVCVWFPDNDLRKQRGEIAEEFKVKEWLALAQKYPEVKFFFYKDKGLSIKDFQLYIPQLRPQVLAKHFDNHPELSQKVIFYHDSDIIFNYLPDFEELSKDTINWQSDTSGYLDYNYLRRKEGEGKMPEEMAINILCKIGRVSVETFKSYAGKTGGAQYILKGIDGDFWRDIEKQVILIRKAFFYGVENSINKTYFSSEAAGFQSWCADMWAVNMALWTRNKTTDVTHLLDFSWATDSIDTYRKKPIYHNAGATGVQPGIFYKGKWVNQSPIGKVHKFDKKTASSEYVRAIMEVK